MRLTPARVLLVPLALGACLQGGGMDELGSFGVGDPVLQQAVVVPPSSGGPESGTFEGARFTLEESAATLILVNQALVSELRSAGLTSLRANSIAEDRPIDSMGQLADVAGVGKGTLNRLRNFAMSWPGRVGKTPPEGTPGEVNLHLTASTSITARLEQTTANAADISLSTGTAAATSDRSNAPQVSLAITGSADVAITVRNYGATPLQGTLVVSADSPPPPSGTPQFEVLFTNPLCHDVSVQGARDGARCIGTEKSASKVQALSYATGAPVVVAGGILGRYIEMFRAARDYKVAHPAANVTIYQSYLSFYQSDMQQPLIDAIQAGVQYVGYFDAGGDVSVPLAVEALHLPNTHIGWLGGHTDGSGTWRLMHNKFTIVDFGADDVPAWMAFSSANLSTGGVSIHFENHMFVRMPRTTNFVQRHMCAIQALEADKYPSQSETGGHEVIFEPEYDACVSQLTTQPDPRFMVFFTPDRDGEGWGGWGVPQIDDQMRTSALWYLIDRVNHAQTSVDMAIEHFSQSDLGKAIRGDWGGPNVRRRITMDDQTLYVDGESAEGDHSMWKWLFSSPADQLRLAQRFVRTNATMHDAQGNPAGFQLQHNKYVIIDDAAVFTGAGNFTGAGFSDNYESFYFIDMPEIAHQYTAHFNHLHNDLGSRLDEIPAPAP